MDPCDIFKNIVQKTEAVTENGNVQKCLHSFIFAYEQLRQHM